MILLSVIIAGYALRIFRLGYQSLWLDEAYGVLLAQRDPVSITQVTASDFHPPLFYYLLKIWTALAGTSEFSARYLSLMLGLLLVPVVFAVAARLCGRYVAIAAAALAALSPFYVHYSQEVRMYILLGILSQLAVYFFLKAIAAGRARDWALYVAFMVLALYSHLYAVLTFAFLNLAFVAVVVPITRLKNAARWRDNAGFALSQIIVVVLYLPWIQVALDKFANFASPGGGSSLDWLIKQTAIVFSVGHSVLGIMAVPGHPNFEDDQSLALALSLPFVAVAIYGAVVLLFSQQKRANSLPQLAAGAIPRSRALFLVGQFAVPLGLIVLLTLGKRDYNARYLFVASPAYYLLVAAGMVALGRMTRRRLPLILMALLFVAIWGYSLSNYYFVEKFARDDHRSTVAYLRRNALPGDLVVLDSDFDPAYKYYAGDDFPWIRFPSSSPPNQAETLATLAEKAANYQRIWLIEWGDYEVDPDRVVQQWLDKNAFRMDGIAFQGPIIVYGYLTSSPVLRSPPQPTVATKVDFDGHLSLLGYDMEVTGSQPEQRIHLTMFWQAQRQMDVNYSVFAHLLNSSGQLLGLGDSQPVNGYLPTKVWQPGQIVRSEMDVRVQPATPPGDYRLEVGVYDQSSMRRLSSASGPVVLSSVQLSERDFDTKGLGSHRGEAIQYGDGIQLLGSRFDERAKGNLHLTLFWRAGQKPSRRYTVFNHIVDGSGKLVAQKDNEPNGGAYPTDLWEPGEVIRDEYYIELPDGLNGDYRLLTGLYVGETGERLTIQDWWPLNRGRSERELGKVTIVQ